MLDDDAEINFRLWTLVERKKMFAQENVYFTDCVLRHMHQYRFIAHFDPDEMPILPKHYSFPEFLEDIVKRYVNYLKMQISFTLCLST